MNEPEYLVPVKTDALQLGEDINVLLGQISSHELRLSHSYARLGSLLLRAKNEQAWTLLGYDRFSLMIEDIGKKIDRRRSQMYAILSVAEVLSPYLSEPQLEAIGIAKSHELRRFVKQSGRRPDVHLLDMIKTPEEDPITLSELAASSEITAAQLRVEVNKLLHQDEQPKGLWYDLGGCYFLPDEKKEVEQFWSVGRMLLEISDETSEHEAKKQVMLAAVRECLGTWQAEVDNAN